MNDFTSFTNVLTSFTNAFTSFTDAQRLTASYSGWMETFLYKYFYLSEYQREFE